MNKQEQKAAEGAAPFLDEGETVKAAVIARPRGWTQAGAGAAGPGALASALGARKQSRQEAAGQEAGFEIPSPMALMVTERRLLVFSIGSPIGMGKGGKVKELVSAAPIAEVDSIESRRLLLGKVITLTVRGVQIKLEVNAAADVKALTAAYEAARVPA